MKNKLHIVILLVLISLFTACSISSSPEATPVSIQTSGSISIARLAPAPLKASENSVMGFLPFESQKGATKLIINRADRTISLLEGDKASIIAKGEGDISLAPGTYSIMHKQRAPLWYAGDSYFTNREMSVPPSGDGNRFLRGALGDFALFIDKDTSIHSSDIWTNEVGGLRIPVEEIQKIYYSLDVGSAIEIK